MAFDRRRSGPPRNSGWLGPSAEAVGCRPRDLRVAFSALAFRRSTSQHRSAVLLPLLGFVSPLRRFPCARPLPETIRWRRSAPGSFPSGRRCHPPTPVPSSWSLTTATVSSARRSRACCIPIPAMGFAAFPSFPHPPLPESNVGVRSLSSRRPHPSKNPPRPQPYRVTAACCPLAVSARVRRAFDSLAGVPCRPTLESVGTTGSRRQTSEEIFRVPPKRSARPERVRP